MRSSEVAFLGCDAALGLLAGTALPARAGTLIINADPNSKVLVYGDTDGDGTRNFLISQNTDNRGKLVVELGSLDREKMIGTVWICKAIGSERTYRELKLDAEANSLGSLEPFQFPSFVASIPIVVSIDMVAFLQAGNPFVVGQVLDVFNGAVAGSPAIIVKDASSLPDDPDFSRDLVASLPNFTGTVTVDSFDAAAVPEPSSFETAGTVLLAALGLWTWRRRRSPARSPVEGAWSTVVSGFSSRNQETVIPSPPQRGDTGLLHVPPITFVYVPERTR